MSEVAPVLVDGMWRAGSGAEVLVSSPATLKLVAVVVECDAAMCREALDAGLRAARAWGELAPQDRSERLAAGGLALQAAAAALASAEAAATGQAFFECRDALVDLASALGTAAEPAPVAPSVPDFSVACLEIRPEATLAVALDAIGERLQAGSAVIAAPHPQVALPLLAAARLFTGLPAGVLNIVTGEPAARSLEALTGAAVITIGAPASATPLRLTHIAADADLELAVAAALARRLYDSGRRADRCARIHVERSVLDTVAEQLHTGLALLECGDPTRPATDLGPLRSARELVALEDAVGRALRQGLRLQLGGRRFRPWGLAGHFLQPTLLVARDPDEVDCEQLRGPVILITAAADPALALQRHVPATRGCELAVFTQDFERQRALLLRAGIDPAHAVWVQARVPRGYPYEARTGELRS